MTTHRETLTPLSRPNPAHTLYDRAWVSRDDVPLDLVGRTVSVILIIYLVLNRVIADRYVLPVGSSVRLSELILAILALAWLVWIVREPLPFPTGLVGLFGLMTFTVIGLAPFIHALTVTAFQANGAERGLVRLFGYTALFLVSFHMAFRLVEGFRVVGWLLAMTAVQGIVSLIEFTTKAPVQVLDTLAGSLGLVLDPNSVRPDIDGVFLRLTGEVRAATTAPHPIVLSAVIALGVLLAGTWLLYAKRSKQTYWIVAAAGILVLSLPVTNSRTAFVILGVAALPLAVLHIAKAPRLIMWALPLVLVMGVAFAISPATPRLLLNSVTRSDEDQNTQVRLERFSRVPELMEPRPYIGAGYLTHDIKIQIFDNAYNLALVELGLFGFSAFVLFCLAALVRMWTSTRLGEGVEAVLPAAGAAAVIALLAGGATFDAWTFDQFLPSCLVLMGVGLGRSAVIRRRQLQGRI